MVYFNFLIPQRPVSLQTKNRQNKHLWKQFVQNEAAKTWIGRPLTGVDIRLTLVYLYDSDPVDTDNIIKPIQDALIGLVYDDDSLITDVQSYRRSLFEPFDVTRLSLFPTLIQGILSGSECVYVRVSDALPLEECL